MNTHHKAKGDAVVSELPLKLRPGTAEGEKQRPWKLLIVDDEPEVHIVTRLALSDFSFQGRSLDFINAYSGAEGMEIAANDPEIAVMLLDVVMETDDAGLRVVEYVRQTLGNHFVRIILRTGHPGLAPERSVIRAYDINDYRAKTELTRDRMFSLMHTSLAAYSHLTRLAHSRRYLGTLAGEYRGVLTRLARRLDAPTKALQAAGDVFKKELALLEGSPFAAPSNSVQAQAKLLAETVHWLNRLSNMAEPTDTPGDFDGNEAAQEALQRIAPMVQRRHAQIRIDNLPQIKGYKRLFVDLLEQLFLNAMQYQAGDAPIVELGVKASGKDWKFVVADHGRGVPAERRDDIFLSFMRISEDQPGSSAGMGLAVCRKIVALHGGKIWVEAREGGGAMFYFTVSADGACKEYEPPG
jgi:signal transduction histidine kinase